MNDHETPAGIDRRTLLRRAGMTGVAVWTTPAVLTITQGVAAAHSHPPLGCPTTNSPVPTQLTFEVTGADCASSTGQAWDTSNGLPPTGASFTPTAENPVTITAVYGGGGQNQTTIVWNDVQIGDDLIIGVNHNGTLTGGNNSKLNPRVTFTVTQGGSTVQVIPIHTSCSKPLYTQESYCGVTLTDGVFPAP